MSRPILSRPRTRVYGCNYDKGESYYKPMVENLDRKYSGRPLFAEPRNSLADEIAARRNDIGTRDLAGSRHGRESDLEFEPRSRTLPTLKTDPFFEDPEDTVFDIRGQRTARPRRLPLSEEFANEVAATTRRLKAHLEVTDDIDNKFLENVKSARTAMEEADAAFRRRSKFPIDEPEMGEDKTFSKWTKMMESPEPLDDMGSAAATRAMRTKARLADLENEMEEMAEKQARRDRRTAALRALVNEAASTDEDLHVTSNKVSSIQRPERSERAEKHVSF